MISLSSAFLAMVTAFSVLLVVAYASRPISHTYATRIRAAGERQLYAILRGDGAGLDVTSHDGMSHDGSSHDNRLQNCSRRVWKPVLDALIALIQSVKPDDSELSRVIDFFSVRNADLYFICALRSKSVYRRCHAAYYLGYLKTDRARKALTLSLQQERKESVKLYLINALSNQETGVSLPDIIDSLKGCSNEFIMRITGILLDFQSSVTAFFPELEKRREPELLILMVEFARLAPYRIFSEYLRGLLHDPALAIELRRKIFACLVESYQYDINPVEYLYHPDNEIRYKAIEALGNNPGKENANTLIAYAFDGLERDRAIMSLKVMARKSTQVFLYLTDITREKIASGTMNGVSDESAEIFIQVILCRLDFFLLKLGDGDKILHEHLISRAMATGKTSDLVSFMNKNYDPGIESALVEIIGTCLTRNPAVLDEIRMYLKDSVLQKLNLSALEIPQKRINEKNESIGRFPLVINLCVVVLVLPIIFFARLTHSTILAAAHEAMNDYLFGFGWYALAANFFYFFSSHFLPGARRESKAVFSELKIPFFFSGRTCCLQFLSLRLRTTRRRASFRASSHF